MSQTVGFVGAGKMGRPMVRRLVEAGHRVRVFARRDTVRARVRGWGAEIVESPAAAADSADVVITCLFSDDQLAEVLGGPDGVLAAAGPGTPVVSHTTGTVATVTELAKATGGGVLLDGPVSGSADDIAAGRLTVLLGGPEHAVQRAAPVLESYADPVITTGELGTALSVKLVNNALFAANSQLVATAVAIGERLGTSGEQMLSALASCSGDSYAAKSVRNTGGLHSFAEVAAPFLRKDVAACLAAAGDLGVDLGELATVIKSGPMDLA